MLQGIEFFAMVARARGSWLPGLVILAGLSGLVLAFAFGALRRARMAWSFGFGPAVLFAAAYPATWAAFRSTAAYLGRDWLPGSGQLVAGVLATTCFAGAALALLRPSARAWFGTLRRPAPSH